MRRFALLLLLAGCGDHGAIEPALTGVDCSVRRELPMSYMTHTQQLPAKDIWDMCNSEYACVFPTDDFSFWQIYTVDRKSRSIRIHENDHITCGDDHVVGSPHS